MGITSPLVAKKTDVDAISQNIHQLLAILNTSPYGRDSVQIIQGLPHEREALVQKEQVNGKEI